MSLRDLPFAIMKNCPYDQSIQKYIRVILKIKSLVSIAVMSLA